MVATSSRGARAATVSLAIASLLLAAAPGPAHPGPHGLGHFSPPAEGMKVLLGEDYALEFGAVEERLVGHHEWREVVPVTFTIDGSEPFISYFLDVVTGQYMGSGYSFTYGYNSTPLFFGPPLLEHVLTIDDAHGPLGGALVIVPESLLWGRSLWPGDAWEVPVPASPYGEMTLRVAVAGDWDAPMVVTVTLTHVSDWDTHVAEWTLLAPTEEAASFGAERTLRLGDLAGDGTVWWYSETSLPVDVVEDGNDTLPFQGRSHVAVVADRDQSLQYGPIGMFPFDPDPHPFFDIHEAGAAAWDLDDQGMRVFRSRAVDPYLASAFMTVSAADVHWRLSFAEQGGNAIDVTLDGVKAADGPLVPLEWETEPGTLPYGQPVDAATRAAMEVAALGRLALLAEEAGATLERPAESFGWDLRSWTEGIADASFAIGFEAPVFLGSLPWESWSVTSDARTAIVAGTTVTTKDVTLTVGPGVPLP